MNIINLRTARKRNNRWLSFPREMDVYTPTKQQKFINWESKDNKFTERKSLQKNLITMKFLRNFALNFSNLRKVYKKNL